MIRVVLPTLQEETTLLNDDTNTNKFLFSLTLPTSQEGRLP